MKMKTIIKEIKKEVTLKLPETLDECTNTKCCDCAYGKVNGITNQLCRYRTMLSECFKIRAHEKKMSAKEVDSEFRKLGYRLDKMFPTCVDLGMCVCLKQGSHLQ